MKHCRMPGCYSEASKTWALVNVCSRCYDDLYTESLKYYAQRIKASERTLHKKIQKIKERVV